MSENEYKDWVLEDYDRKVAARLLTAELASPTPGGLKAESVKVCERRFNAKDEIILRSFFNEREGAAAYRIAIQNSSAEIFKSLTNFLRDRSIATSLKNINLLAWLIDFQPRPYHYSLVYKKLPPIPDSNPDPTLTIIEENPPIVQPSSEESKKTFVIYILVSIALVIGGYFVYNYFAHRLTGNEKCMYWEKDHYQPINCNEKPDKGQSQPINKQLVANFRKINKPDTLTPYSVGKVWYVKYNGKVDFFTADGPYPIDTNKRLLRMSEHVLRKYVYHLDN